MGHCFVWTCFAAFAVQWSASRWNCEQQSYSVLGCSFGMEKMKQQPDHQGIAGLTQRQLKQVLFQPDGFCDIAV